MNNPIILSSINSYKQIHLKIPTGKIIFSFSENICSKPWKRGLSNCGVSNFRMSNYEWLKCNSSPKHHHNFCRECLIVARLCNLHVACVLAITLGASSTLQHMGKFFKLIAPIWLRGSYVAAIYSASCYHTPTAALQHIPIKVIFCWLLF